MTKASDLFYTFSHRLNAHPKEEHHAIFREILHNLGYDNSKLWLDITLSPNDHDTIESFLDKLNTGMPLQYVLGKAPFYNLDFVVNEHTLIPRPETEELVHLILTENPTEKMHLLDVGTGSGCIPIALLQNRPQWNATALDISKEALKIAKHNAKEMQVTARINLKRVDVLNEHLNLDNIDILVSNPPYVANHEKENLSKTVLDFEPNNALFTGTEDPLIFYKTIEKEITRQKFRGKIYLEVNPIYKDNLEQVFKAWHFRFLKDMQGKYRFIAIS